MSTFAEPTPPAAPAPSFGPTALPGGAAPPLSPGDGDGRAPEAIRGPNADLILSLSKNLILSLSKDDPGGGTVVAIWSVLRQAQDEDRRRRSAVASARNFPRRPLKSPDSRPGLSPPRLSKDDLGRRTVVAIGSVLRQAQDEDRGRGSAAAFARNFPRKSLKSIDSRPGSAPTRLSKDDPGGGTVVALWSVLRQAQDEDRLRTRIADARRPSRFARNLPRNALKSPDSRPGFPPSRAAPRARSDPSRVIY